MLALDSLSLWYIHVMSAQQVNKCVLQTVFCVFSFLPQRPCSLYPYFSLVAILIQWKIKPSKGSPSTSLLNWTRHD